MISPLVTALQPGLETGMISMLRLSPKSGTILGLRGLPKGFPKLNGGGFVLGGKLGSAIKLDPGKHVAPPLYEVQP